MKKTGKKLLALLLALMMLACAVPFSASAEQIEDNLFKDDGFYYELKHEYELRLATSAIITGCDETVTGEVVIPSTIGGYPVSSVRPSAFCDRKDITKVTLSDGVVWRGDCTEAYRNDESNWEDGVLYYQTCLLDAKGLVGEYKVKEGTITIAEHAFSRYPLNVGNDELTSLILPDSVKNIEAYAIICDNLENLDLGDGVEEIWGEAGIMCPKLKSIVIPESIEYIGWYALNCKSLENITLPDKAFYLIYEAFEGTTYYKNEDNWDNGALYIGNHLVAVDPEKFRDSTFVVRDGTVGIAGYAFKNVDSVETIKIPDSVKFISPGAFAGCTSLRKVDLPKDVSSIFWETYAACTSLVNIEIPGNIKFVGSNSFMVCQSLLSVKFLDGVSTIGDGAFQYCTALNDVSIPDSVKYIGEAAFYNCPNLKKVAIPASVETIGVYALGYYAPDEDSESDEDFIKMDDFTIYGHKGTAAEKYAIENGFAFVDLDAKEEPVNPSEGCPCRCHKGGFENFIYKFLRIFWRLFRTHEFCECGVKHY